MADPRLKAIADAALTRVAAIAVTGGYNFDAGESARASRAADESTKLPAAYIVGVGFEGRFIAMASDGGPNAREATAVLHLRLVAAHTATPQQEIEKWAYDVIKALEGLPLGLGLAYVISVVARDFEPLTTDLEIQKPHGMANLRLAVTYRMARGEI